MGVAPHGTKTRPLSPREDKKLKETALTNFSGGKIKLGISTCLLGEAVRYDGGHKLDRFLTETLGQWVEYVPVCPEVESGMSIPREAMRLVGDPQKPRLMTVKTQRDMTQGLLDWAYRRARELESEELCGFIFEKKSPSSGMKRIKVYDEHGMPHKVGVGLWARAFMEHFPLIPVEDSGRLHDPQLRENFIERIFTMMRWREMIRAGTDRGGLVDFHTRHKLLIMAHGAEGLKELGKLVAHSKETPAEKLFEHYLELLMECLKLTATVKKQTNVLQHAMGYFKTKLSADEKQELLEVIGRYHDGYVPLIVPITLLNHYVRKYEEPYLASQHYLSPHPIELKLRNHV